MTKSLERVLLLSPVFDGFTKAAKRKSNDAVRVLSLSGCVSCLCNVWPKFIVSLLSSARHTHVPPGMENSQKKYTHREEKGTYSGITFTFKVVPPSYAPGLLTRLTITSL